MKEERKIHYAKNHHLILFIYHRPDRWMWTGRRRLAAGG
jgi:hypothetical protein